MDIRYRAAFGLHRYCKSINERSMTMTLRFCDDEVEVPIVFVLCNTCGGRGKYVNPNVDRHGLEEADEDYLSGVFDVKCRRCDGKRVEALPDYGRLTDYEKEFVGSILEFVEDEKSAYRTYLGEMGQY